MDKETAFIKMDFFIESDVPLEIKRAWKIIRKELEEAAKTAHNKQSTPLCDTYLDAGGQRRCRAGFDFVKT